MIGIGIAGGVIVFVLAVVLAIWSSRYIKVGPDEALVVSGRKRAIKNLDGSESKVGYRIVRNGATFVVPVLERVSRLSLEVMNVPITTQAAMSKEGVPLSVSGTALFKVGGTDEMISSAAERYLGRDAAKIMQDVKAVLEGHLRGVCGTLTPEQIYSNRQAFQYEVSKQAQPELTQLGIQIDTLTLSEITDTNQYLASLGQTRTAQVVRDARVGKADANREATIREAEAKQASDVRTAETQVAIAAAQRDRDVKQAEFLAEVQRQQAIAAQAEPRAKAQAQQQVVQELTTLAERKAEQAEKELVAAVIKPAEAQAQKARTEAEGLANAVKITAEASKQKTIMEGEGTAAQTRVTGVAEADANRAKMLAQADGEKAKLLAEAEGQKAKLLAEAEGLLKKADAMRAFNDASMALQVATELIRTMPQIVAEAVKPISYIDSIRVVDFGSNGHGQSGTGSGMGPLDKLMGLTPKALGTADEVLKQTLGLGLAEMVQLIRTGKTDEAIAMKREKIEKAETSG